MRSYFDALFRAFDFAGRTSRAQYWTFMLFSLLATIAAAYADYRFTPLSQLIKGYAPITMTVALIHTLPQLAISVRRLHDIGRSGWWYLLYAVPLGGLVVLFWSLLPSEPCRNDYGAPYAFGTASPATRRARVQPEPFYARALRPSSARNASARITEAGAIQRFI